MAEYRVMTTTSHGNLLFMAPWFSTRKEAEIVFNVLRRSKFYGAKNVYIVMDDNGETNLYISVTAEYIDEGA